MTFLVQIQCRDQKSSNVTSGGCSSGGGGARGSSPTAGAGVAGGGGESSCESPSDDNEGTAANVSFADTIDAADLDLETRGDRNRERDQSSYGVSQWNLTLQYTWSSGVNTG